MPLSEAAEASEAFVQALKRAVPDAHFDRTTRLLYSTDASIYQMVPVGVALPRNADEVSAAIEVAAEHGVPVLPRGGGSSLAGQAVGHALILDVSRYMDQVIEIDPEAMTVRTQPGITHGKLNRILAKQGLLYGPDPASGDRATMGGIMGNNSTGAHSIVYGMTVDHVLSIDAVLSDGSRATFGAFDASEWAQRGQRAGLEGAAYRALPDILDRYAGEIAARYPKTFRHVAGYNLNQLAGQAQPNLAKLLVGSEGTLAVTTEALLNVVPLPRKKRLAMVHFAELRQAMESVPVLLESQPSAVEVLDRMMLDLTRDRVEYRRLLTFVEGNPEIVLLVEYAGDTEAELDAGVERLQAKLRQLNHKDPVVIVSDPIQQANVWYVRKVGLGILMSVKGDAKPIPFIEDAAVPVEYLADYVTQIYDYAYQTGVKQVAMYAHASAGCIHIRPLVNLKTADGVRQLRAIAERSVELVVEYGGTTSGEHGEGLVRGEFSEQLFGPELVKAFHEVKNTFDPAGRMNPGKVVNAPPMDDESLLRYGTDYATPYAPEKTVFHFNQYGNFVQAVEMCNGAGVCRKLEQGVMCPSFQATRDETHSTRGRANALRSAMMGELGTEGMTSQEVYDVLDLCLSCKACYSECPSSVDMAKIKAEFLYHYQQAHGTPLRSRMFGRIDRLFDSGQRFPRITNAVLGGAGRAAITQLGIHPARQMPALAPETFSKWYRQHRSAQNGSAPTGDQVVFWHDTFTEHNHPEVGKAAIKVLEAAGFDVIFVEKKKCCGRPAMSKGLLDDVRSLAEHNVALLAPYARQGIPIVGVEPSCMSMLADDYRDLDLGTGGEIVANMVMTLEAFLVQAAAEGKLDGLRYDEKPRRVLFHGHCQQKATFGTVGTTAMLSLIPNCEVETLEAGCCGMAGSFGYETEHYDLSIKLAEMVLAPAVRAADRETIVCATGASCRDQIDHTTEREAIHPIEVFASALL